MASHKVPFSTYLLKADQADACEKALFHADTLPLIASLNGRFLPIPSGNNEPAWVGAVRAITDGTVARLGGGTPAGLLLIKRPKAAFVITFGHAWQLIEEQWIERAFGLRAALNAIPKNQVIEVRTEQVFAKWHLASERAPRASALQEFGVDFDRDLVAVVEGKPTKQKNLGETIRGGTSLRLHLPVAELPKALDDAHTLFTSTAYRKEWPDIDTIIAINNATTIATLDDLLDQLLATKIASRRVALFTPAQRRDEALVAESYVYGRRTKNLAHTPYLTYENWCNHLAGTKKTPSVDEARHTPVHILDGTANDPKTYSVYDCFGVEVSLNNQPHILTSGTWYEVDQRMVTKTNRIINDLQPPSTTLPAWDGIEHEPEYNKRCAKSPLHNCDRLTIRLGSTHSQFECCDLLNLSTKTLYFVKIASKSSGMSHLVEQARRTAELLFGADPAYRVELKRLFTKYHPSLGTSWLDARPRRDDWTFCMVSMGRAAKDLPFFAKCALVKLHKHLTEQGHGVTFLNV